MYVPFEDLLEESKIWSINRIGFSDAEFSEIETDLQAFLENCCTWNKSLLIS
jgi:hypothetical protein